EDRKSPAHLSTALCSIFYFLSSSLSGRANRPFDHKEISMAKDHGKQYVEALKKIDRARLYTPEDAVKLIKETSYTKFDATVEVHLRLGIDPRHADQNIRTTVALPHGTGRSVRVLVFAQGEAAQIAQEAGADFVGSDDLIARVDKENFFDFDVAIATP